MSAPPQPRVEVVDRQGNAILLRGLVFHPLAPAPGALLPSLVAEGGPGSQAQSQTVGGPVSVWCPLPSLLHGGSYQAYSDGPLQTPVVYRDNGHHYVRGIVSAPDHEDLHLKDWHVVYRANSGPWGRPDPSGRVD